MNYLKKLMSEKVNIGARIYAMMLIVYNGMSVLSYYNIMKNPDILRQAAGNMSLQMTEEQVQTVIAEIPLQLALIGIMIFGLVMLILNQRWGFIPFAAIPTYNAIMSFLGKDPMGGFTALLPVVLMALILFIGPGGFRQRAIPADRPSDGPDR